MKYTDESGKDAETLAVLMDKAYAQGYLLTDDIIEAFPKAEEANEQLEELFAFLHGAGIDVYEDKADVPVLKGISFHAPAGTTTAETPRLSREGMCF